MRKKTIILTSILSVAIFLSIFAINVMAEKRVQGAFSSDKTERSLIKDIIVGQREIKAILQQINKKIDNITIHK